MWFALDIFSSQLIAIRWRRVRMDYKKLKTLNTKNPKGSNKWK